MLYNKKIDITIALLIVFILIISIIPMIITADGMVPPPEGIEEPKTGPQPTPVTTPTPTEKKDSTTVTNQAKEAENNKACYTKPANSYNWFLCKHMTTWYGTLVCEAIWITSAYRGIQMGWYVSSNHGTCAPEKPLVGTDKCQSCNANPYMLCTKQRCEILGKCIAVPAQNFSDPKITAFDPIKDINYRCIPGQCDNRGLVGLSMINASIVKADGTPITNPNKWSIATHISGKLALDLGTIPYDSRIMTITIATDQLASCRYIIDKPRSNFSDMQNFDNYDYPETINHNPDYQTAGILIPGDMTRDSNHTVYIKCSNICGAEHNQDYDHDQVRFKFSPKPDSLPPEITFFDPQNNGVVRNDWKKLNVSLWLDENGGCSYSTIINNYTTTWESMTPMGGKDKNYSNNENTSIVRTICMQSKECTDLKSNKCAHCYIEMDLTRGFDEINWSSLPAEYQNQIAPMGLFNTTKMFTIMLRCNDTTNNKIPEDEAVRYTIMTMPPYNISIIKPENNSQTYDPMPDIQVTSDPRLTQCRYAILDAKKPMPILEWNNMWPIDDTVSTIHTGKHNETLDGANYPGKTYNIQVICQDQWGLEARDNLNFSVINDTKAPILIRTYHDSSTGDSLVIETDEPSTCAYTFDRCNFNFSQGQMMTIDNDYIHTAYWSEKTFFIKCQDEYGNILADNRQGSTKDPSYNYCTAILKPFNIPSIG